MNWLREKLSQVWNWVKKENDKFVESMVWLGGSVAVGAGSAVVGVLSACVVMSTGVGALISAGAIWYIWGAVDALIFLSIVVVGSMIEKLTSNWWNKRKENK